MIKNLILILFFNILHAMTLPEGSSDKFIWEQRLANLIVQPTLTTSNLTQTTSITTTTITPPITNATNVDIIRQIDRYINLKFSKKLGERMQRTLYHEPMFGEQYYFSCEITNTNNHQIHRTPIIPIWYLVTGCSSVVTIIICFIKLKRRNYQPNDHHVDELLFFSVFFLFPF